jgi:predicted DsbA family dithiol-disulfide isomerase
VGAIPFGGHGWKGFDLARVRMYSVEAAWRERRFRRAVDASIREARLAGVRGAPAMAWPNQPAIVGMMRPEYLVARLASD